MLAQDRPRPVEHDRNDRCVGFGTDRVAYLGCNRASDKGKRHQRRGEYAQHAGCQRGKHGPGESHPASYLYANAAAPAQA